MSKFLHSKNERARKPAAMSLIELLTCVMIIGIATAGSMELAYVNAFWAANGINKADNLYAARRFLDVFNRDLRNASTVNQQWSPPKTILTLVRSEDFALQTSQQTFDGSGFPTASAMSQITYTVAPDLNSTDAVTTEYIIQRQEGIGSPTTVLAGVVGPSTPGGSQHPCIFQFSSSSVLISTTDGLATTTSSQTNSVIVNLELKRASMGTATTSMNQNTAHSFEAIRSEIFLRNSNLQEGM